MSPEKVNEWMFKLAEVLKSGPVDVDNNSAKVQALLVMAASIYLATIGESGGFDRIDGLARAALEAFGVGQHN